MIYYLDHPQHGVGIEYDEAGVKRREALGWVLRGEKAAVPQPEQTVIKKNKGGRPRKVVQ